MALSPVDKMLGALHEQWAVSAPVQLVSKASPAIQMLKKGTRQIMEGTGVMRMPVSVSHAASGASAERLYALQTTPELMTFDTPPGQFFSMLHITHQERRLGRADGVQFGGEDALAWRAFNTATGYWRDMGSIWWSNGTGRIAKGDGAYSVAGNEIKFKNRRSAYHFQPGVAILLIDETEPVPASGMPTPRALTGAGYPRVVGVSRKAGTITLDQNLTAAFAAAANTDYIGQYAHFLDASEKAFLLPSGFFRWIPFTKSESLTTWAGVNRSVAPELLSGQRVRVSGSSSPHDIIGDMLAEYSEASGSHPSTSSELTLFVPGHREKAFMAAVEAGKIVYKTISTANDANMYVMGVKAIEIVWPSVGAMTVVFDAALHDPDVTDGQDQSYVLTDMATNALHCEVEGFNWVDGGSESSPYLNRVPGKHSYYADFGALCNFHVGDTALSVVASTRADL